MRRMLQSQHWVSTAVFLSAIALSVLLLFVVSSTTGRAVVMDVTSSSGSMDTTRSPRFIGNIISSASFSGNVVTSKSFPRSNITLKKIPQPQQRDEAFSTAYFDLGSVERTARTAVRTMSSSGIKSIEASSISSPLLLSKFRHEFNKIPRLPFKRLVQLEEQWERTLLQVFRFATHPIVLLDVAILILGHAMSLGWLSFLFSPLRRYKSIQWMLGYPRRWLRVTGSARRWTRLVSFVLERRSGSSSSATKMLQQLARVFRNPLKSLVRVVMALWEHRSRYSLLSDYAWYVNTNNSSNNNNAKKSEK